MNALLVTRCIMLSLRSIIGLYRHLMVSRKQCTRNETIVANPRAHGPGLLHPVSGSIEGLSRYLGMLVSVDKSLILIAAVEGHGVGGMPPFAYLAGSDVFTSRVR